MILLETFSCYIKERVLAFDFVYNKNLSILSNKTKKCFVITDKVSLKNLNLRYKVNSLASHQNFFPSLSGLSPCNMPLLCKVI